MKFQVEEQFGKFVIVQTNPPFRQVGPAYTNHQIAEAQIRRLLLFAKVKEPKS